MVLCSAGWLVITASRLPLREAVAAVDRPVPARLKRHFRVLAALCADCWEELLGPAAIASAFTTLGLTSLAAVGTTFRVRVTLLREELLVIRGVGKALPAVSAGDCTICI